jgi:hypothetical protein
MAPFNVSTVASQSVGSTRYWPSAHVASSSAPSGGPLNSRTITFIAAATSKQFVLPPSTDSSAWLSSSTKHSTAGAPDAHACITRFKRAACLVQADGPNSKKLKPYFVTHRPVASSTVVVADVVGVVVVVGDVVAVVVVVSVLVTVDVGLVVCEAVAVVVALLVAVVVGEDVTEVVAEVVGVVTSHALNVPSMNASVIKFKVVDA